MSDTTSNQVKNMNLNPTGKGGFGDHPENINKSGTWAKGQTFRYWFDVFKDMSVEELKEWQHNNPENVRTVAADLAFTRVVNAKTDLKEFQEVADRSEGKASQPIKHEGTLTGLTDIATALQKIYDRSSTEQNKDNPGTEGSGTDDSLQPVQE